MTLKTIVGQFVGMARREILRDHTRSSCIASTRITIDVFHQLGFAAEPLEVVATVGNGAYSRLRATHGPPLNRASLESWATVQGAQVVGIGHSATTGGVGGHLVAVVESSVIVDAALDQANLLVPSLRVPSVVAIELRSGELNSGLVRRFDPALFIEYTVRPALNDWRSSPDWQGTPETETAVARIIAKIEASLGQRPRTE
jgi:hypothetical protein